MTKRRFRSASGAIFVPNVDEATIRLKVAAGEWAEIPPPAVAVETKKPRRRSAPANRNRD